MLQGFKKEERLCSRKMIKELFESGQTLSSYPVKIIWKETKLFASVPVQIVISVPKRNIKKAVDRNKIKRQIREVYRKNKNSWQELLKYQNIQCSGIFIYMGKKEVSFQELELAIIGLLKRLITELKPGKNKNIPTGEYPSNI